MSALSLEYLAEIEEKIAPKLNIAGQLWLLAAIESLIKIKASRLEDPKKHLFAFTLALSELCEISYFEEVHPDFII